MPIDPISDYFDRHSERYDELFDTLAFQLGDAYDCLAEYVAEIHHNNHNPRVLELGIGTGKFTSQLLKRSPDAFVTGVDVSADMLKIAERNLAQASKRISLVHGPFPDAIPDSEYDCVVSALALSFYSIDYGLLFKKVHQCLVGGGICAYVVNVAHNSISVDNVLNRMLRRRLQLTEEQISWLKSIRQGVTIYQNSVDWYRSHLLGAGFVDVDCFYLKNKIGAFVGTKPKIAL